MKIPRRMHYLQRIRQDNMNIIRGWIKDSGGIEKVNVTELLRKSCLIIGCTRKKAIEYLSEITGETY